MLFRGRLSDMQRQSTQILIRYIGIAIWRCMTLLSQALPIVILAALLGAVALTLAAHARGFSKLTLKPALTSQLDLVLQATNELHTVLVEEDMQQIQTKVQKLISVLGDAQKKTVLDPSQQTHLHRILQAAQKHLELSQIKEGPERQDQLRAAFKQIVLLVGTYELESYRVYFCSKDKSVWIQKSLSPKNPISTRKYPKCGSLVPR